MNCKEIDELSEIAKKRGGELISTEYKNNHTKISFRCFHNHIFNIIPRSVKQGRWCPKCKIHNRTEEICRIYFEHIFGSSFPKKRPDWLIGNNGYRIELDGYSPDRMVAFEYNGAQHYKKTSWYGFDDLELARIKQNEIVKISTCKERGITIVIIDYKTRVDKFLYEIKKQLINANYPDIDKLNWTEPSLVSIYTSDVYLNRLRDDLLLNGFILLDTEYRGETAKYIARCNVCGYERKAEPFSLRKNLCKRCSKKERKTIDDARKLAESRDGVCLSENISKNSDILIWKCKDGHIWKASYNNVQKGTWCPIDGERNRKFNSIIGRRERKQDTNKIKLKNVRDFAHKNGFELLSDTYINCDSPLIFQCQNNHQWSIGFRSFKRAVKQGRGCTYCGPHLSKATKYGKSKDQ